MNKKIHAIVEITDKTLFIPTKATLHSAGFDLQASIILTLNKFPDLNMVYAGNKDGYRGKEAIVLKPGFRQLILVGFKIALPLNTEAQIRPRSGLALKHGITVLNSPGTIDSDYRGEVGVILYNTSNEDYFIAHGDRIAQMVITSVPVDVLIEGKVDITDRGTGGFGHTGK
jgi:dUTP pyrophosphatase